MELGRGLQGAKDSEKRKERHDIWPFLSRDVSAPENRLNIQCVVSVLKLYWNCANLRLSIIITWCEYEPRDLAGRFFKMQCADSLIILKKSGEITV